MFLHLGENTVIPRREIIAIIDVKARKSPITEEFIDIAKDEGFIKDITLDGKAKSFVITTNNIYLSPISCITLKKRTKTSLKHID
ncbi:MAG: DUF370 domain-containing protein [Clostridiales bacterium]|nr:DUF370 domain-containing protein [Clostridiales bacterium]MCF8021516.1 DUF370 domain-containing protein [Clostridiales bacterium]